MGGGSAMSNDHREESFSNFLSATSANPLCEKIAGMTINSMPNHRTSGGPDPLAYPGWDGAAFPCSSNPVSLENCGIVTTSHTGQYYSDPGIAETVAKLPFIGGGKFSEMVGSFGLAECGQVPNMGSLSIYPSNEDGGMARTLSNSSRYGVCQLSEERDAEASPNGKRRKGSNSPLIENLNRERQKFPLGETGVLQEHLNEKKQKIKAGPLVNSPIKQMVKKSKDSSLKGHSPTEDYVHVRAKRGQATSSHSLAERVRREKISERMKLLQDLVPGCNKVTGKALMLDEIINYVQSLQHQVKFLSMKLANVNPELNVDLERLLSKDILHSSSSAAILGSGHGINPSYYDPNGIPQLHPMPQAMCDGGLHNAFQTGNDSKTF